MEKIVLGGGCFWCLDASFQLIKGVEEVVSGFAGGDTPSPSYHDVARGMTGHAEVVQVSFDTTVIGLADVLDIFWAIHDPTTLNRQGNDVGSEYRSIILYTLERHKPVIDESIAKIAKLWPNPVVTEVVPLDNFYPAEPEHQNFFAKHPEFGYCQVIINPKLEKLKQKFASRIK